jgi:hypothetical protein
MVDCLVRMYVACVRGHRPVGDLTVSVDLDAVAAAGEDPPDGLAVLDRAAVPLDVLRERVDLLVEGDLLLAVAEDHLRLRLRRQLVFVRLD